MNLVDKLKLLFNFSQKHEYIVTQSLVPIKTGGENKGATVKKKLSLIGLGKSTSSLNTSSQTAVTPPLSDIVCYLLDNCAH